MKQLILLLPALFLVACGNSVPVVSVGPGHIDAEFEQYANSFVFEAEKRAIYPSVVLQERLSIVFDDESGVVLKENAVASCYHNQVAIVVKRDFFDKATKASREVVLYHELAHCLLGYKHRNNFIMSWDSGWWGYSDHSYFAQRDQLLDDMFYENGELE